MDAAGADAVIVGAGAIGSSIALELARSGMTVVVVDRRGAAGHGSTSASSGVVRFNFSTRDGVALAWEARHGWENWREHLLAPASEGLAGLRRCGLVMLDADPVPRHRVLPLFDDIGVPYEEWDAGTLAERVPGIDVGRYWPPARLEDDRFWAGPQGSLGAVYTPDAGYVVDPMAATGNLAAAAARHGAVFRFGATVSHLLRTGERVRGVQLADGAVLRAGVVVNAAGPWSGGLNRLAGVGDDFRVTVRPLRQEVHYVPAPPGYFVEGTPGPVIADVDLGIYVRAEGADGLLVGGVEPECDPLHWLDDPDDAGDRPTTALFEAQVTRAARRFPGLGVPARPRGIVGVYDVTEDWAPIYDRTALGGFYVAIGTSGNQFKNAPVVGRLMSTLIHEVEKGVDHDSRPVAVRVPYTGRCIDMGSFSRLRKVTGAGAGNVFG